MRNVTAMTKKKPTSKLSNTPRAIWDSTVCWS